MEYLTAKQSARALGMNYERFLDLARAGQYRHLTMLNGWHKIFTRHAITGEGAEQPEMLYGVQDVAKKLKRNPSTVWGYIYSKRLVPSVVLETGKIRVYGFTSSDVIRFMTTFMPKFEF